MLSRPAFAWTAPLGPLASCRRVPSQKVQLRTQNFSFGHTPDTLGHVLSFHPRLSPSIRGSKSGHTGTHYQFLFVPLVTLCSRAASICGSPSGLDSLGRIGLVGSVTSQSKYQMLTRSMAQISTVSNFPLLVPLSPTYTAVKVMSKCVPAPLMEIKYCHA